MAWSRRYRSFNTFGAAPTFFQNKNYLELVQDKFCRSDSITVELKVLTQLCPILE